MTTEPRRSSYEIAAELRAQSAREADARLRRQVADDLPRVSYQRQTLTEAEAKRVEAAEKSRRFFEWLMRGPSSRR